MLGRLLLIPAGAEHAVQDVPCFQASHASDGEEEVVKAAESGTEPAEADGECDRMQHRGGVLAPVVWEYGMLCKYDSARTVDVMHGQQPEA